MKIGLANLAINYVNYVLRLWSDSATSSSHGEDDGAAPLGKRAQSLAVRVTSTIGQSAGLRTRRLRFEGDRPTA